MLSTASQPAQKACQWMLNYRSRQVEASWCNLLATITVAPLQNSSFMLMPVAKKNLNRSIPMPDNASPTGAIRLWAKNHRFASFGAVRPGFEPSKMVRALSFCMAAKLELGNTNTRCNNLAAKCHCEGRNAV
jgi:hypothetical protein